MINMKTTESVHPKALIQCVGQMELDDELLSKCKGFEWDEEAYESGLNYCKHCAIVDCIGYCELSKVEFENDKSIKI